MGRIRYYICVRRFLLPVTILTLLALSACYRGSRPPRIGTAAPDFTVQDQENKISLSQFRGQVVVLNFWATWCPPCRKEMPDLEALYKQFEPQGLVILGISDDDPEKVREFVQKQGTAYPVLLDPGSKVNELLHIQGIPKTFVYDREGKIVAQSIDMRTRGQFLEMLGRAGVK